MNVRLTPFNAVDKNSMRWQLENVAVKTRQLVAGRRKYYNEMGILKPLELFIELEFFEKYAVRKRHKCTLRIELAVL